MSNNTKQPSPTPSSNFLGMSFFTFVGQKNYSHDLVKDIPGLTPGFCCEWPVKGFMYPGDTYISENHLEDIDLLGRYNLHLGPIERNCNNLDELEWELYHSYYAKQMDEYIEA